MQKVGLHQKKKKKRRDTDPSVERPFTSEASDQAPAPKASNFTGVNPRSGGEGRSRWTQASSGENGGRCRDRTYDIQLVRLTLYQLS